MHDSLILMQIIDKLGVHTNSLRRARTVDVIKISNAKIKTGINLNLEILTFYLQPMTAANLYSFNLYSLN